MSKLIFIFSAIIFYSCASKDKADLTHSEIQNDNTSKYQAVSINDSLQPFVDSLIKFDAIFDEAVGYGGSKPEVYTWFEKLAQSAENDELIRLTSHSSPTVRGYSFWALVEREDPKVKEIMLEHVDDSVYIERMSGCLGYQEKLNDFMLSIIAPNCVDTNCSRLPPEDMAEIKAKMK